MAFGSNNFPIGPGGGFPGARQGNAGMMIAPPVNEEGEYFKSAVAKLPTEEKEFASVANKAKVHLTFGEPYGDRRSMRKMGRGFQLQERIHQLETNREGEKKYLENRKAELSGVGAAMRIPYVAQRMMQRTAYRMGTANPRAVSMWSWRPTYRYR